MSSTPIASGLPARHPEPGLPARVTVYEVGPRDGLQSEREPIPATAKVRMIEDLVAAGLPMVEATSFVRPGWIPQLADAEQVLAALSGAGADLARHPVLVPNDRGLDRALAAGAEVAAVFVSATEPFARRNLNRGLWDAVEMAQAVTGTAVAAGVRVRGYVSMAFGDPWEGPVEPKHVAEVARALVDAGCYEVSLGDTIGVGTPGHVGSVVDALADAGLPPEALALHAHDTFGQALANVHAALRAGVTTFDASVAGIGGCPYAGTTAGNLATEDLLWMLTGLGIETGVDLDATLRAGRAVTRLLGRPAPSRVVQALTDTGTERAARTP